MADDCIINNPHRRVVEDLKIRNKNNGKTIAGEYFGSKFSYDETFRMFRDFKAGFISLDGLNEKPIVIAAPSTIASVNSFYGAIDADKPAVPVSPGFLNAFTSQVTRDIDSQTAVIFDGFLSEELIKKLHDSGVKNVIITSITDYMNPVVKKIGQLKGAVSKKDFLDEYIRSGKKLPDDMQFIRLEEFAKVSSKLKEEYNFPYKEGKIGAYFLTGATTSRIPKCAKIYADGLNMMADIYQNLWFDFGPGTRHVIFIPIFYATGAVHGIHASLFRGMTAIYQPRYDRFAFAKDLKDLKANLALVAPSHVATLDECGLPDKALKDVKYIFIGGEAVTPAQMEKFRSSADRLGIEYVLNGYGMTETASMTGVSDKNRDFDDVTIVPVPGVKYRIVDPETHEILGDNQRGILEKYSPCEMAGYTDEEKNKTIFTADGWINTGDIAIRFSNGKYRVYGRATDCFTNAGKTYAMFDIEEEVLKHPGISEAEVIKFMIDGEERPAVVVVVKQEWKDRLKEILCYINDIKIPGAEYLLGTRFIERFATNPITAKRDYLILPDFKNGYYSCSKLYNYTFQTDIDDFGKIIQYPILDDDIIIHDNEKEMKLKREL